MKYVLLCEALQKPHVLQELNLSHNQMTDAQAIQLTKASGTDLKIDVSFNQIFYPYDESFPSGWTTSPPDLLNSTVPVEKGLDCFMQPNEKMEQCSVTKNIMTITEGILAVQVAFGKGGDSDQHLGVMKTEATAQTSYTRIRSKGGWCIKDSSTPFEDGENLSEDYGDEWPMFRGETLHMLLDMNAASVSFWHKARFTRLDGLPKGVPLTAALSLYNNTANIIGIRHILQAKAK